MKEEQVLNALSDLTNGALNYYQAPQTVLVRDKLIRDYIENLQSQLKAKEEAEKEFIKLLEYKWNESQDIWFIKLLNKYKEITSKQAKENDEILSKVENK